jgi:hypothetical protein
VRGPSGQGERKEARSVWVRTVDLAMSVTYHGEVLDKDTRHKVPRKDSGSSERARHLVKAKRPAWLVDRLNDRRTRRVGQLCRCY